jgi:hypothetical protein
MVIVQGLNDESTKGGLVFVIPLLVLLASWLVFLRSQMKRGRLRKKPAERIGRKTAKW